MKLIALLLPCLVSASAFAGGVDCRPPYCGSPIDCHPCDEEDFIALGIDANHLTSALHQEERASAAPVETLESRK